MKIENEVYLVPIDDKKSFYNKAIVKEYDNGEKRLYSYNTHVATIDNDLNFHRIWNGYSATTLRHVNSFLAYYGIDGGGKKWWDSQPCEKDTKQYKVYCTNGFATREVRVVFDSEEDANEYAEKLKKDNYRLTTWVEEVE